MTNLVVNFSRPAAPIYPQNEDQLDSIFPRRNIQTIATVAIVALTACAVGSLGKEYFLGKALLLGGKAIIYPIPMAGIWVYDLLTNTLPHFIPGAVVLGHGAASLGSLLVFQGGGVLALGASTLGNMLALGGAVTGGGAFSVATLGIAQLTTGAAVVGCGGMALLQAYAYGGCRVATGLLGALKHGFDGAVIMASGAALGTARQVTHLVQGGLAILRGATPFCHHAVKEGVHGGLVFLKGTAAAVGCGAPVIYGGIYTAKILGEASMLALQGITSVARHTGEATVEGCLVFANGATHAVTHLITGLTHGVQGIFTGTLQTVKTIATSAMVQASGFVNSIHALTTGGLTTCSGVIHSGQQLVTGGAVVGTGGTSIATTGVVGGQVLGKGVLTQCISYGSVFTAGMKAAGGRLGGEFLQGASVMYAGTVSIGNECRLVAERVIIELGKGALVPIRGVIKTARDVEYLAIECLAKPIYSGYVKPALSWGEQMARTIGSEYIIPSYERVRNVAVSMKDEFIRDVASIWARIRG